jgi:hypothetical protein
MKMKNKHFFLFYKKSPEKFEALIYVRIDYALADLSTLFFFFRK